MPLFDVGDVVVCVDDRDSLRIRRGSLYRVEALKVTGAGWVDEGALGVYLIGVRSEAVSGGFRAERFRKIDADVTEEFRETLRKLPVREPAL